MSRISGSSYDSRLMSRSGDGSTLSLDFTAMGGTLDPRITFSRADATPLATFINSLGYVATVATAQAPRFDYDPTTLVAKGLLIEASATNLFSYSEDFSNGSWLKSNATASTNATTAPNGNATADYMLETAGTSTRFFAKDSGSPGTSTEIRTFSVYVKILGRQWVSLCAGNTSGGPYYRITVDLSTGTISSTDLDDTPSWFTTTPTNSISPAGPAGSGWYRITITSRWCQYYLICPSDTASPSNSGSNFGLGFAYLGDTNSGVILWGAQLELGGASSYIPTVASTVTRAVDTAIIAAGSNFSSWYTGGTTGTFVANWYGSASSATARSVIATNDQTTKHLHLYQTASALTLRLADFGAAATVTTSNSLTAGALTKGAFSYNGTATSLCLNGGTVATGTLAFSAAPTWLSIGGPSTNGTSITATDVMLNNSIRTLKYFPARLSDGQIQGLTT